MGFRIGKNTISQALSLLVIAGGLAVMAGWLLGNQFLISISPDWVNMKFMTAISFVFSGLLLFSISKKDMWGISEYITSVCTLLILLFMLTMLASIVVGINTNIENSWIKEAPGAINTPAPGRSALVTVLSFIIIGVAGMMEVSLFENRHKFFLYMGALVAVVGAIAVVGYALGIPFLYYNIGEWSSAIAVHGAFFFVMLGAALALLGKSNPTTGSQGDGA